MTIGLFSYTIISMTNEDLSQVQLETMTAACEQSLDGFGQNVAKLMLQLQAGKKIKVEERDYQLQLPPGERLTRVKVISAFLENPKSANPKNLNATFMQWLDQDEKTQKGQIPHGDWKTAVGEVKGKSLYGASLKEFGAIWADHQ